MAQNLGNDIEDKNRTGNHAVRNDERGARRGQLQAQSTVDDTENDHAPAVPDVQVAEGAPRVRLGKLGVVNETESRLDDKEAYDDGTENGMGLLEQLRGKFVSFFFLRRGDSRKK